MDFALSKVVTVNGDIQVALPAEGRNLLRYCIEEQGRWFEPEIEFVRRWFPKGGVGVDIGANFGIYSLEMSMCAGVGGKVWAFEPDPRPRAYFCRSKGLNFFENIAVEGCAVGGVEGEAAFSLGEDSVYSRLGGGAGVMVSVTTLDVWHDRVGNLPIDFLKLDVEGGEEEIIRGGVNFFKRTQPTILLEYYHRGGTNLSSVKALESLGYKMFRYVPAFHILAAADLEQLGDDAPLNLFAVFEGKVDELKEMGLLSLVSVSSKGCGQAVSFSGKYELCVEAYGDFLSASGGGDLVTEFARSYFLEKLGLSLSCIKACQAAVGAAHSGNIGEVTSAAGGYGVDDLPLTDLRCFPEWVMASLLHRQEMLARPTSFFHPDKTVVLLEASQNFGYLSPSMSRRLRLARNLVEVNERSKS